MKKLGWGVSWADRSSRDGGGERRGEVPNKRTEGFGESELETALQLSVTLTVTAVILYPKYLPVSPSEPLGEFCCHHHPQLAFRGCFTWMFYCHAGSKKMPSVMWVKCNRFELLTLWSLKGECGKNFEMSGVTSFGNTTRLMRSALQSGCCPYHLSSIESWNHKLQIFTFHPWRWRKHRNEGVPFLSSALWLTSPFSQLLYTSVTITFTSKHTQKHASTHICSHEGVSCTSCNVCVYDGDGVTNTGLILALNIWCAERSLVCVFHQLCCSPSFPLLLCLRSEIVKRL